jgi:hypothetical protein
VRGVRLVVVTPPVREVLWKPIDLTGGVKTATAQVGGLRAGHPCLPVEAFRVAVGVSVGVSRDWS